MGKMSGSWEGFFPNGVNSYKGSYKDNLKTDQWTYWNATGKKREEGSYKIITETREQTRLADVTKSVQHGNWKFYDKAEGKLASETNFKSGKKSGKETYYYRDIVISEATYKGGLLHGTSKNFDKQGNLLSSIQYKDNVKHGTMKLFNDNGSVLKEKEFKFGYPYDKNQKGYRP